MEDIMTPSDTTERAAVVVYMLLDEFHRTLTTPKTEDEITLGIVLGTAMYCDEKVGPFRAQRLMEHAPGIVLKTDAYVPDTLAARFAPVLQALGEHLQSLASPQKVVPAEGAVTAA